MVVIKRVRRKKVPHRKKIQPAHSSARPSLPILFLVLVIGIIGALTIRFAHPSLIGLFQKAPKSQPASATLSLIVDKQVLPEDTLFTATIILDSPNQPVQAGDFIVIFDPSYLTVLDVVPGTYFRSFPIKKWGESSVHISGVALLTKTSVKAPIGKADVGKIIFKTRAPTLSTSIAFDTAQTVVAANGKNILGDRTGVKLTIIPSN